MTPKIIHYVWVGDAPKPPIVLHCIESWKKFCPGWEIREWGNECLETIDNKYLREALAHRKWAFVADYLRLKALKDYGGFYFDTDLELFKPIDAFCENDFTTGFIDRKPNVYLNMCFLGASPQNQNIVDMLKQYDEFGFVQPNGELDQTPNVVRFAQYFVKRGFNFTDPYATETISPTEKIYPVDYFNSRSGYAYHHLAASWLDEWTRKMYLKIGPYKLLRFKQRKEASGGTPMLFDGERAIWTLRMGPRKWIYFVKSDK